MMIKLAKGKLRVTFVIDFEFQQSIRLLSFYNQLQVPQQMPTYILPECESNFKEFKYNGGNDSITYEHIWSPLAEKLLNYTPSHIAPNVITLTSLVLLSSAHVLFVFAGDNSQGIAGWKLLLMSLSIIVYQNLDNLDGKQARKTKSSSPLGMLFDHGTDAVASFLISIQVLTLLEIQSPGLQVFCLFTFVMLIYFCAMWSQYSVGYFRLGRINPVDEGLPSYAIVTLLCLFLPGGFWNQYHWLGKYNEETVTLLGVLVVLIIYFMVRDNFTKAVRSRADVLNVLLLPVSYAAILLLLFFTKQDLFSQAYLPICYALMFSWSRNMIEIQVYFVTKQKFNPFNIGTLSFIVPSLIFLFLNVNPVIYYWIVTFFAALIFLQFVTSVLNQGSSLLGIKVFSLATSKKGE